MRTRSESVVACFVFPLYGTANKHYFICICIPNTLVVYDFCFRIDARYYIIIVIASIYVLYDFSLEKFTKNKINK